MKSPSELIAAAHLNYIGSYRKIAEHSPGGEIHPVGKVFTFSTGWPIGLFNGCVIVAPVEPADLDSALRWLSERELPYQVAIVEELLPGHEETIVAHGLRWQTTSPGMVLYPVPDPPDPTPGVAVVAGNEGGLADYVPPSLVTDPDVRVFTARLDGRPAGTSIALRTGGVLYLFALRRWTASAVSYVTLLMPLVTVPLAAVLVAEEVSLSFLVGGGLALAGVYIGAFLKIRPRRTSATSLPECLPVDACAEPEPVRSEPATGSAS